MTVLEVKDLRTTFKTEIGELVAVNDISFSLDKGQIMGLVGESGSGKTVTGFSLIGLVSPPGWVSGGSIRLQGQELRGLPENEMRRLRGNRIAMIFQDPMSTLNPVLRVDTQMIETVLAHQDISWREAWQMSRDALGMVGIPSPEERLRCYPHQFSGGMRQRVAIAIAMLHKPDLIIADEPTTALDVTIQAQILAMVQNLASASGTSLIWITHDLSVVSGIADNLAVMYAGNIVESGPVAEVLYDPRHPYTEGLIASLPSSARKGEPLRQIDGLAPSLARMPAGCAFRPRCPVATDACLQTPKPVTQGARQFLCFNAQQGGR